MTNTEISCLAKDAPALRQQHLQDLIKDAEEKSDTVRAQAIFEILRREAQKKKKAEDQLLHLSSARRRPYLYPG